MLEFILVLGGFFIRVAPGHDEPNSLGKKKSGEELCLACFGWGGFFFFSLLECYFLLIVKKQNRRVGKSKQNAPGAFEA